MIITKTPYRISFFGGGSDYPSWYIKNGGVVLSTTIDKYIYISCRYLPPFFEHKYRIVWSQMENVKTINEIKHRAVREMLKYFKTTNVKLGDYQKLVRGNKEIPIWGMPDVITAMNASNYKDGKIRVTHGESYIQFAKFSKKGTEIESIISYGASDHEKSKHYSDQMDIYKKFGTKKMSFNREENYKNAVRIYNPR